MADRALRILLADDDPDDQLFVREALQEASVPTELQVVGDGLELMDCLRRSGRFTARSRSWC